MKMKRYVRIEGKYPREIVLLKSNPCFHGKCIFCDYIEDNGGDFSVNKTVLSCVTGDRPLQIIDSASYFELSTEILDLIDDICIEKNISERIIELHWKFRRELKILKERFPNISGLVGVETFDINFRRYLKKAMPDVTAQEIAEHFDWVNILFGIKGQSLDMLKQDVDLALRYFKRMNLNIFVSNSTAVERDNVLIEEFYNSNFFEEIKDNINIDILDFADSRAPDNIGGLGEDGDMK